MAPLSVGLPLGLCFPFVGLPPGSPGALELAAGLSPRPPASSLPLVPSPPRSTRAYVTPPPASRTASTPAATRARARPRPPDAAAGACATAAAAGCGGACGTAGPKPSGRCGIALSSVGTRVDGSGAAWAPRIRATRSMCPCPDPRPPQSAGGPRCPRRVAAPGPCASAAAVPVRAPRPGAARAADPRRWRSASTRWRCRGTGRSPRQPRTGSRPVPRCRRPVRAPDLGRVRAPSSRASRPVRRCVSDGWWNRRPGRPSRRCRSR